MRQFTFPAVRGMTINNLQPNRHIALLLKNFINDENGIYVRSGCVKIYEGATQGRVVSYHYGNVFLFLMPKVGKVIELPNDKSKTKEVLTNFTNGEIVESLETNNRVIVFFDNNKPFEILRKDTGDYVGEEVTFTGVGNNISFSGGAVYKNRIFYYKQGSSQIYYTLPLAYKGELKEYNLEGIFGVKGKLHHLFTMGFNAGAHVTSYLLAVFDSGDILVFRGLNPEDPNNWEVVLKTSLNASVYKRAVSIGTTAYLLTGRGIIDLARVISTNSININEAIISNDLVNVYDGELKDNFWSKHNLKELGNFLLVYSTSSSAHYLYNFRTGGFSRIEGWKIESVAIIDNKVIFSYINKVFQGFKGNNDDGNYIIAEYITNFESLGNCLEKRTQQALITIRHTGQYQVYFDIQKNNIVDKSANTAIYLTKNKSIYYWSIFRESWLKVKSMLWNGAGSSDFYTIKVSRNKLGRNFAAKLKVINLDIKNNKLKGASEFVLNNITISYETWGM